MYRASSKIPFCFIVAIVFMNASFYYVKAAASINYSPTITAVRHDTETTSRRRGYYSSNTFGRRNIHSSTVSNPFRRRHSSDHRAHMDDSLVSNVNRRRATSKTIAKEEEGLAENGGEPQMSFHEMKQQLGPFSLLVANGCEVGVVTAGSYLSGGFFGYFIGGIMSVPTLFQPFPTVEKSMLDVIRKKIANCNSSAFTQAKSWGQLSAAFSGFQAAVRIVRGNQEDKWNGILGSACTGAFLNRNQGPQAMLQSASTYAAFTYMIDSFMGPGSKNKGVEKDFDFNDAPIDVEERGF